MIDCGVNAIINICDSNEFDSGKSFVHIMPVIRTQFDNLTMSYIPLIV
jgi:hypothetical protein